MNTTEYKLNKFVFTRSTATVDRTKADKSRINLLLDIS